MFDTKSMQKVDFEGMCGGIYRVAHIAPNAPGFASCLPDTRSPACVPGL